MVEMRKLCWHCGTPESGKPHGTSIVAGSTVLWCGQCVWVR